MELATLDLEFRTDSADKALADVNRLTAAAAKAERAAGGMGSRLDDAARKAAAANDNLARSAARVTSSYDRMVVAARKVITAIGALGGLLVGAALVRYADTWTDITSRVNIAAGSIENGRAVMERLDAMARRTYSSMSQTAESYLLNATAMRELGYSTNETLDFVEAINNALVVSGAKGDRAASVMNALSKAMATGKLSGDELNTVIAVGGRVAEALAKGMGVTTNQLRSLGQQGKITGDVLAKALIGQLSTLREEADGMAATIGDGMLLIGNAILSVVGRFDQATGASSALAGVLVSVADGIKVFGDYAIRSAQIVGAVLGPAFEKIADYGDALVVGFNIAGAALVGWLGPVAVGAVLSLAAAIGTTLVGAVKALTIAMMANPIGLFVGAVAAAVTAVYLFRDEIKNAIGVDVVAIGKDAANFFVGAWVATFEAIRIVWTNLPGVMGDLAVQAGNALIAGIEGAINILVPKIRELYRILNPIAGLADLVGGGVGDVFGTGLLDNFKADFGRFDNQFAGRASATAANVSDAFTGALFTDYIGALGEVIASTRSASEATADLDAKVKAAGSSMDGKASNAAQKLAKAYKEIVDRAQEFIRSQEMEARLIGMSDQAANALRYEFDLLNDARRAGATLTATDEVAFKALAEAMAGAEARTKALRDAFHTMKDLAGGFMKDFLSTFMRARDEGKGFWQSFAEAGVSALERLRDKLIDLAIDNVINSFFSSLSGVFGGGGKGGGLLSSIFGGLFGGRGAFPAAPSLPVGLYHDGGVVGMPLVTRAVSPSLFDGAHRYHNGGVAGLRPDEVPAILQRGERIIPRGANSSAANQNVRVEVEVFVNDDGTIGAIARQEGASTAQVLIREYDKGRKARLASDLPELKRRGAIR